ncbi:MAG: hypothetical protein PHW25_02655 [Zoogloea sp.]|jgi:hypothetical protein|uniref:Periplasmic protein n=1 Tax=Zoogloea ramigera TaxID=350 RepID=A0A4Y4CS78_ZOORA|nr:MULTISPECIES: hypothetical protein [Zoogloea]MBP6800339.1 hypothetical protein [Zoogloea sp.]MBP7625557.1 hypothetical protein [Zoogloea sp.]MDD3325968.1 hypothetical protein [Zoogloea sp.]GEC94103.1 periplasmic protein [Zoogloea ramigera]
MRLAHLRLTALSLALALPLGALAAPLIAGSSLPPLSLEDQHGKAVSVPAGTRVIVFAADKAASDLANEVLGNEKPGVLERLQAVYVADISGMPSLVTKMFALPAMRALPFPIGLARESAVLADLPRQKAAVTVIRLADGKVQGMDHAKDTAQLKQMLGLN